ncbi:unnamed protein product [Rotaria magnacalcarata]|uniref:F-box domain-containing protein n=1 Tax=Rotaria magnacalcarata TaxID=392030 RepID=A0A816MSB1_9BILA|nr:unnamed protein product [Rotaria magnacalcarata]
MTDASLLTLPIEVIHHILAYCDTQTILLSIRPVCKHLYSIVNSYDQFELTLDWKSKSKFQWMYRLIPTEGIVKLNILRNEYDGFVDFFLSVCDLRQFTRLRSLTIQHVGEKDLVSFFQLINTHTLTSLSINPYKREISTVLFHITSAIEKFQIRRLCMDKCDHIVTHMSWPVDCTLTRLEIGACHYHEYITVLQRLPQLRTIIMKQCVMNDNDVTTPSTSDTKFCSLLKSLTITDFSLFSQQQLELLISFTPALVHLKLTARERRRFDYVFDGLYWENFIRINLLSLKKFEICFHTETHAVNDLVELITPFRTPFWVEEKRWLIACAFIIWRNEDIWLYTMPISVDIDRDPIRCEISSRDGVCRLTKRCLNQVFDITADETLKILGCFSSGITDKEMRYLSDGLQKNTTITTLSISSKNIGSRGIQHLATALQNNTTLTALHLNSNRIEEEGAQYLGDALKKNTTLTTLELKWNEMGPREAYNLARALRKNATLTTLDLCGNNLKDEVMQHLGDALRKNATLTTLNLQANQIRAAGIQHLANGLRNNKKLATLDLKSNSIGEAGAPYLADILRNNTTLTALYLEYNYIKDDGVQYVASALRHNATLTILSLCENGIKGEGAQYLADALRNNSTLKKLYLYQNRITPDGAKHLADALRINTTLTTFGIGWNLTGIELAQHFAEVIRHNKTLIELDIHYNYLGDEGAAYIADALRYNTKLAVLDVSSNGIRQKGLKQLADALENNTALTAIDLCFNGMEVSDAKYFANTIRNNRMLTEVRLLDEHSWEGHSWELNELHKKDKRLRYEHNRGYRHFVSRD